MNDPGYDVGAFWARSGVMEISKSNEETRLPARYPGGKWGSYNCVVPARCYPRWPLLRYQIWQRSIGGNQPVYEWDMDPC